LLLTEVKGAGGAPARNTLFMACGLTHEHDLPGDPPVDGWLIAFDVETFRQTAAWCTTPHGLGAGIWQAGGGPAADENGDVYVMTGNYSVENSGNTAQPAPGDLPESFVKLHYTAPGNATGAGHLEAVGWFTAFRDVDRNKNGDDNFQDYDLGSGGPIVIPGTGLVLGAGKDGVLYVLDRDTNKFGKGNNYAVLKQRPPIFFTYFPGFVDAEYVPNLDHLFDGKTYHLHGNPVFWRNTQLGAVLFVGREREPACLGDRPERRHHVSCRGRRGGIGWHARNWRNARRDACCVLQRRNPGQRHRMGFGANLGRRQPARGQGHSARIRRKPLRSGSQCRWDGAIETAMG
jgi:hypothetical protein